jgi:hypothetical protein
MSTKYHEWINGDLVLDIDVELEEGTKEVRATITRERIKEMLVSNPEGAKFFLREVLREIRPNIQFNQSSLKGVMEFPDLARDMLSKPPKSSDDFLPPQIREMEEKFLKKVRSQKIRGHILPVEL